MTDRSKILPPIEKLYTDPSGCPRCGAKWHTETTKKLAEAVVGVLFCLLCAQQLKQPEYAAERKFWRNWSRQMRSRKTSTPSLSLKEQNLRDEREAIIAQNVKEMNERNERRFKRCEAILCLIVLFGIFGTVYLLLIG